MMPPVNRACETCKHRRGIVLLDAPEGLEAAARLVCDAFPKKPGVPDDLAFGKNPHTKPYPGDHGIQWEPVKTRKK